MPSSPIIWPVCQPHRSQTRREARARCCYGPQSSAALRGTCGHPGPCRPAASAPLGTPEPRSPNPHPSSASAWPASSNRPARNQKSGDWEISPRIIPVAIRPHGLVAKGVEVRHARLKVLHGLGKSKGAGDVGYLSELLGQANQVRELGKARSVPSESSVKKAVWALRWVWGWRGTRDAGPREPPREGRTKP